MISSFSSLYQPERRNTWDDSPHYPRSSSSWVPLAPDHRKPPNKISCVSSQHDTYLTILLHWNICSPADRLLDWVRVELDKPWLEKKIIRDISHFWRTSARWKGWHWKCYFSSKYSFYHIYTLASQCHWSALWQILCVHRNHRRTFEKKDCVLSLSAHLYQTPISEGSCSKRAPLLQTYFA